MLSKIWAESDKLDEGELKCWVYKPHFLLLVVLEVLRQRVTISECLWHLQHHWTSAWPLSHVVWGAVELFHSRIAGHAYELPRHGNTSWSVMTQSYHGNPGLDIILSFAVHHGGHVRVWSILNLRVWNFSKCMLGGGVYWAQNWNFSRT